MKQVIATFCLLSASVLSQAQTVDEWVRSQKSEEATVTTPVNPTVTVPVTMASQIPLAQQGDPAAQFNLAQMYRLGNSGTKDYVRAIKWYRRSAAKGSEKAQFNLGLMYYFSQGTGQNLIKAHMWLNISAMAGMDNAVKYRNTVAKEMTTQQVQKAMDLAKDCVRNEFKGCD